jgi:hypothetical protein
MKDYTYLAVIEASSIELMDDFVDLIKTLDTQVAKNRLTALMNSQDTQVTFWQLAGQFVSLADCKTSADRD